MKYGGCGDGRRAAAGGDSGGLCTPLWHLCRVVWWALQMVQTCRATAHACC